MIPDLPPAALLTADDHMRAVCAEHGLTREQLRGWNKRRARVEARREFMFRTVFQRGLSLSESGRLIRKDHTTVLHGIRRYAAEKFGTPPRANLEQIAEAARWHGVPVHWTPYGRAAS